MPTDAIRVTVTLPSGETVTGGLVRLTDFDVTLYDAAVRADAIVAAQRRRAESRWSPIRCRRTSTI